MFDSLLIANRGEIAARVIRTARRLGLRTIAVYSDADAGARHVRLADEAVRLGPAAARESYLAIDRVLEAARKTGAQAIHPGYGVLSENAECAAACSAGGLAFVGPPASAIAAMGSKRAAKEAMAAAGVPVLPGYHGAAQDLDTLEAEARRVGFPLIVKPSGGGGGKGMRIVQAAAELPEALAGARRLAESAFADPSLLIERYLPAPRHVEVQILCDAHGTALHLGTRDCSVQRRHQKLLEEAPAPDLEPEVRERLHAAALTVARSVGYVNAGTVEFLYADGEFFFMEMNTRLQVEHCVTEEVYGVDLVEWQLRIAAGDRLTLAQRDLLPRGHAIEARVCAEDPAQGFAPSAGRLARLDWPAHDARVRVDAGFETADLVPTHYDSLLGKVVGRGADREAARRALVDALGAVRVVGIATNVDWLRRAAASRAFAAGGVTTRFVAEYGEALVAPEPASDEELALAALAWVESHAPPAARTSPWSAHDAFRLGLPAEQRLRLAADGREAEVAIEAVAASATNTSGLRRWRARVGAAACCEIEWGADGKVDVDGRRTRLEWHRDGTALHLWRGARHWRATVVDPREVDPSASAHEGELVARLPGTVVAVEVAEGQSVAAGAILLVLEAMKMEHAVVAPRAGTVRRLHYAKGERVPEGAVLVELGE
ncbi:MAG: acetyl/propionyl/methylcrotonyl-CoA carboxylase subunit alpha [Pseudomonadota bacterium]